MLTNRRIEMCTDRCIDCTDMRIYRCIDMRTDVGIDTHIWTYVQTCVQMCVLDMHRRACRHVLYMWVKNVCNKCIDKSIDARMSMCTKTYRQTHVYRHGLQTWPCLQTMSRSCLQTCMWTCEWACESACVYTSVYTCV